jgi:succinoglycan biosynthesis transport protein ExoP
VLTPVANANHIGVDVLKGDLTVGADSSADLVKITATSSSATGAAQLANGVADALIAYRTNNQKSLLRAQAASLEDQLSRFSGRADPSSVAAASDLRTQLAQVRAELAAAGPDLAILTPASPPTGPSSPHPRRNGAIGLLVGLVLGIALALFRERLDRRTRTIDEIEAIFRVPLVGTVPFLKRRTTRANLLADFSTSGTLADAYRTIRANLSILRLNEYPKTVLVVTSSVAEEGKSAVTANLGHALSVVGKKVLVISADLHNPALHEYFSATPIHRVDGADKDAGPRYRETTQSGGLVQVLGGEMTLSEAARVYPMTPLERTSGGSLAVLANEGRFFDPAVLFNSASMRTLLSEARQKYDVIILDTPPLLANSDAVLLAQGADAVVLVARLDRLTRNQARRANRILATARIHPIGVIVSGGDPDGYGYGYGYQYGYESTPVAAPQPKVERAARRRR